MLLHVVKRCGSLVTSLARWPALFIEIHVAAAAPTAFSNFAPNTSQNNKRNAEEKSSQNIPWHFVAQDLVLHGILIGFTVAAVARH